MLRNGIYGRPKTDVILFSEAMLLRKRLGVGPQVADIINTSTGRYWSSEVCVHGIT